MDSSETLQTKTLTAKGSKGHHTFTLTINENSTDSASNASEISFDLSLSAVNSSWIWRNWGSSISWELTIGSKTYNGTIPNYDGSKTTIKSDSFNQLHNDDGSKTINIKLEVTDTTGTTYTCGNASASGTMTLTPIPRGSIVKTFNYTTLDEQFKISLTRYSDSFNDTVYVTASMQGTTDTLQIYKKEKTTLETLTFEIEDNLLQYLLQHNKSATAVNMEINVTTRSGDTWIEAKTFKYNNIPIKKIIPDVSATIVDTNTTTKDLTGSENVIVKYLSKPKVTINATPKQEADIKNYSLSWSGINSTNKVTDFSNGVTTNTLNINATDTRNWDNPKTINLASEGKWIEYIPLNINTNSTNITRPESTSSILNFKCSGEWFNGNFSSTNINSINLKYRWAYHGENMPEEYTNIPLTASNNTFSCDIQLGNNFDYDKQVDFEFILNDLASAKKFTFNVESGESIIRVAKTYVRINGDLKIFGNGYINHLPILTATKSINESGTNLNDYLEDGTYFFGGGYTPTNIPSGNNGWLHVMKSDTNLIKQIWYRMGTINTNDFQIYVRTRNSSTWSKWRRLIVEDDIYYKSGDTYEMANAATPFGGFITGGKTDLQLATIFLPKSLKNINSITLNQIKIICRQNDNYILGTAGVWFSDVSKIIVGKISDNCIRLYYTAPSEITDATNNDSVGVALANLKVTFS